MKLRDVVLFLLSLSSLPQPRFRCITSSGDKINISRKKSDKNAKKNKFNFKKYTSSSTSFSDFGRTIRNYRRKVRKQIKEKAIEEQPTQSESYDTKGQTDDTKGEEKVGDQVSEKDSDVTSNTLGKAISLRRIFSPKAKTKSTIFAPITKNQQNLFRKKPLQPKSWAFPVTRLTEQFVPDIETPPIPMEEDTGRLFVKRLKACLIRFFNPHNDDFPIRMLVHVAFVIVVTSYLLLDVPKNAHFLGKAFIDNFIDKNTELNAGAKVTFLHIHLQEEVWMFLTRTLVGGLEQYKKKELTILEDNHLIGSPRIRIVVVAPKSCIIPLEFEQSFEECFGPYSPENEVEIGTRKRNNTFYRSARMNGGLDYSGYIAKYSASGYVCLLEENQEVNTHIINELEADGWLEGGVRAMFVDFTVYNPNVNMFAIAKFVFERASTGAIIPSYQIQIVDLYTRIDDPVSITRSLKILFFVFLMIIFLDLLYGLFREKLGYIFSIFVIQDIVILVLSIVYFVYRLQEVSLAASTLNSKKSHSWELTEYHDFDKLAQLDERRKAIAAILLFCLWMKLFKYLTFTYTMSIVATSLANCANMIYSFLFMFLVIFFGFIMFAHFLFGLHVVEYITIPMTALSLGKAIVSSFNYEEMWDANPELAFFFLAAYIGVTFFLVLNMFIAILTDTYTEVLKYHKQPSHWTLSRFWYNISQRDAVKYCYTSALRKEGFPSKRIPLILAKYNLGQCDEAIPSVVQKIVDEEIIGGGEEFDKTLVQQEIVEIERSMQVIEWYIQFTVIKVEEYILKVELYVEAWAEILKETTDKKQKDKAKKK